MLISRSRNSHIRSPRSVTIVAIGMPLRTLNAAIDFFDAARHRLLAGDARELVGADVDELGVRRRLAEAHVDDDLAGSRGTAMTFV